MNPNGQRLLNQSSTARALLRCIAWINPYDPTTSVLSFVRGVRYQLIPSCIRNAFCQALILKHVLAVQLFKCDHAEVVHQFTTQLMGKVFSTVGNALMDMLDCLTPLRSFRCCHLCLRELALCSCKLLLIHAKEAWIFHLHTSGQGSKTLKPYINTYSQLIEGQRLLSHFASQAGIPIANRIPLNNERFYFSFDRAMKNDLDCTYLGDKQTVVQQFKTKLFESEAVIPSIPTKSWIARLLTCLHPAKECFESKINSLLNVLQDLRENTLQFRMLLLPDSEQFVGVVQ